MPFSYTKSFLLKYNLRARIPNSYPVRCKGEEYMYCVNESDYSLLVGLLKKRYRLITRVEDNKLCFNTCYLYDGLSNRKKDWEKVYKNYNDIIALLPLPSMSEFLKKYNKVPFAIHMKDKRCDENIDQVYVENFMGELINKLISILKELEIILFLIEFKFILPQNEMENIKDEIVELLLQFETIRLYIISQDKNDKSILTAGVYEELQYDYIYKKIKKCIMDSEERSEKHERKKL